MSMIQEHDSLSIPPFSITPFISQPYYCGNKDNVLLCPIITYSVFESLIPLLYYKDNIF